MRELEKYKKYSNYHYGDTVVRMFSNVTGSLLLEGEFGTVDNFLYFCYKRNKKMLLFSSAIELYAPSRALLTEKRYF